MEEKLVDAVERAKLEPVEGQSVVLFFTETVKMKKFKTEMTASI